MGPLIQKYLIILLVFFIIFPFVAKKAFAIENPLGFSNNKFGIHILFPEELDEAARFVNSNGGDWGYVTVPIQETDKNLIEWQAFMDKTKTLHIIPIIRLATTADYYDTNVWQKPIYADVLDFANFLNSLDWPTKNRYIIIFNEPNRNAEWGKKSSPQDYADILDYSVDTFKSINPDFFVISAGLDNGADTNAESINEYEFIREMGSANPNVFEKIDGISSHSYPNPGFSQPPTIMNRKGVASFIYESRLIKNFSNKDLPVFITETGWSRNNLSDATIASYYKNALSGIWANENIVAITPFLLEAGSYPFSQFSFLDNNHKPSIQYEALFDIGKVKGKPILAENENKEDIVIKEPTSVVTFLPKPETSININAKINTAKMIFKWFLHI